jgi:formin-binding protein 1
MKMKSVYEANAALGDPMSVEGQLNDSGHKLDKLRQEQQKFLAWLEEADGKGLQMVTNLSHIGMNLVSPFLIISGQSFIV